MTAFITCITVVMIASITGQTVEINAEIAEQATVNAERITGHTA